MSLWNKIRSGLPGLRFQISALPGMVHPVYPPENVLLLSLPQEKIVDHSGCSQPKPGHNPGHDGLQVVEGVAGPVRHLVAGEPPGDCGEVPGQEGQPVCGGDEMSHDVGQVGVHSTQGTGE